MSKSLGDIRGYWNDAAQNPRDADGLRPTARDPHLQSVVETAVEKWIPAGSKVVDIGCGDGLSTLRFAKRAGTITGLDYIPAFVEASRISAEREHVTNVRFEQGDVLDLSPQIARGGQADVAVTIRCLINLPSYEMQKAAIAQIASLVRPGGTYLLSEGWVKGWEGLGAARKAAGLQEVTVVEYNRLLSERELMAAIDPFFDVVAYESLGFYLFMSRVFQPAFRHPNPPRHDHGINKVAAQLYEQGVGRKGFEEYDYAGVYVLRRKDDRLRCLVGYDPEPA